MAHAAWIAADWGTTHLRVWVLAADGQVVARHSSEDGMAALAREGYEAALLGLIAPYLGGVTPMPVVICGMAGSRQGWAEAPYATVPCAPPSIADATHVATNDTRLSVSLLPGVKQTEPADVMRGEETQVAGFLALNPEFDGVLCLPGTHSKWVHVSAGEIVSFRTFMTGEMFSLLAAQSVLRHSVAAEGWDKDAFLGAVDHIMGRPAALAADLFALRAEALLTGLAPDAARARLSGLLIGAELAAAKPYWLGQNVAVLGAASLAPAYRAALEAQGVPVTLADADRMTLEGLRAAFSKLKDKT